MKKYCLTKCFKRKMSGLGVAILTGLSVTIVSIVAILIFGGIAGAIGYLWLTFMNMPIKDPVGTGVVFMLVIGIITVLTYYGSKIMASIVTGSTNFVVRKYEGEPFQCTIFEECRKDDD